MREIPFYAASILLFPFLLWQGWNAKRRIPRLTPAKGPNFGDIPGGNSLHLLVLGESTVAGVGIEEYRDSLAGQIASILAGKTGKRIRWEAIGESGITAGEARRKLQVRLPAASPDIIVIALGANDAIGMSTRKKWTKDLLGFIAVCRNLYPGIPIFLAGVPPIGIFPSLPWSLRFIFGWKARLLDQASSLLSNLGEKIFHVPMRRIRTIPTDGIFCSDGFHPSEEGCRIWAEEIADSIVASF